MEGLEPKKNGQAFHFRKARGGLLSEPREAVAPLIPYLHGIQRFAEPCARDGDLVEHPEAFGLRCLYVGDVRTGQDALAADSYGNVDAIITDPPHSRELMHRLIAHFQRIAPTWLLIDYDWASTKQAAPFLPCCSDIVAIGSLFLHRNGLAPPTPVVAGRATGLVFLR
jgi:hypothetical protein